MVFPRTTAPLFRASQVVITFLKEGDSRAMPSYRAFLIETVSNKIVRSHNFEAYDEAEALSRAERYVSAYDVELWNSDEMIKRFPCAK